VVDGTYNTYQNQSSIYYMRISAGKEKLIAKNWTAFGYQQSTYVRSSCKEEIRVTGQILFKNVVYFLLRKYRAFFTDFSRKRGSRLLPVVNGEGGE